jgi:hypothetical protein
MRTIHRQILKAIHDLKPLHYNNTEVRRDNPYDPENNKVMRVYLFGHHIVSVSPTEVRFTLAGWPTATTRARINAILTEFARKGIYRVWQDKHTQYFGRIGTDDQREIASDEWITVKR